MTRFRVEPIAPNGKRTAVGFRSWADGRCSGPESFEVNDYPPSPQGDELRSVRVAGDLGLRDAARALGLSVVEVSGLETGRHRFSDPSAWEAAAELLRKAGRAPKP